eukprot:scaffold11504_cov92-Isochrysis_galbana.AAC.2
MAVWSAGSMPISLGAINVLTLFTAVWTPFPMYRGFESSRSSTASYAPVDAPDGTDARDMTPSAHMSTSTVGLPRESKIERAKTFSIDAMHGDAVHRAAAPVSAHGGSYVAGVARPRSCRLAAAWCGRTTAAGGGPARTDGARGVGRQRPRDPAAEERRDGQRNHGDRKPR